MVLTTSLYITIFQASQDEAVSQKESLVNEVRCLRGELQQLRDERDRQVAQVQILTADIMKYQESTGKSFAELDNLMKKTKSLEACFLFLSLQFIHSWVSSEIGCLLQEICSSQTEQICLLEHQLTSANEKLKVTLKFLGSRMSF